MAALDGITVVDLTLFLPGPMLSQMMADQGARVIKVEPPAGDPARAMPPFDDEGRSVWFEAVNRGKECRRLDLKSEEGKAELRSLIRHADVLLEGFRPGTMARLGFDLRELRRTHPRLVTASLSAFGQTGPLAHHPAHDLAVQAYSGFLSVNDGDDGVPVVPGVPSADMAASLTGLSAVLMALLGRERTGEGAHCDIAMLDSLLPWSAHLAGEALLGGPAPRSSHQRSLGGAAFYRPYRCKDGRFIVLGGREEKFARTLLDAIGRPDLIPLSEAPAGEQAELIKALEDLFATRTRDEWTAWFEGRDVAFAPVLDFAEAFRSEQVAARGLVRSAQFASAIRLEP
jgi:crotonobetainyl-CoA:carnitine CoA-transferase CaiB-like acyl-CoA transferase